ncbi:MAG: glycosyltransferase family 8 protein [Rickettsiales bacterium]|jgi:lipopolysaccharide biosynthesis glycosyltransferase|nr:glycosyltransferase family 8 protein [Rickettsiales bacterium]
MNKAIPVCFVATPNFTGQLAVAIASLASNTKSDLELHILECDVPEDDLRIIHNMCGEYGNIKSIKVYPVDNKQFIGMAKWQGCYAHWARFLFPELAKNVKKGIYLDCDVVIMNDIKQLYDYDLDGFAVAAAPEIKHMGQNNIKLREEKQKLFGYSDNHVYFCSGVLIFDCEKWRGQKLADKIYEIGKRRGDELGFPDQDALNILFADNYKVIENSLASTSTDVLYLERDNLELWQKMQKRMIVRHYVGFKPWISNDPITLVDNKGQQVPHLENFWYYAQKTPYFGYFLYKAICSVKGPAKETEHAKEKIIYKLFGIIPLVKISHSFVRLFGIIPLIRINKKSKAL